MNMMKDMFHLYIIDLTFLKKVINKKKLNVFNLIKNICMTLKVINKKN
jgi:hypothetical protein